ncbi:MAG TPA: ferredoxin [Acidimicrobiales bacterium]|nr:ferredoxin [Acidimicrobiales bacterium]
MTGDRASAPRSDPPAGPVRLQLDGARCDGHGICSLRCPERVALDEWGFAVVDPTPISGRASVARAVRACNACPADALTVVGSDGGGGGPVVLRDRRRRVRR